MEHKQVLVLIERIVAAVEKRLPEYLANEADRSRNDGNSAICIIDDAGVVHGKMFGSDKLHGRHVFRIAWTKASQVWITGIKTGEFEKRVFTGEVDEHKFGILRPDFIGWEGGLPVAVDAKTKLAIGFSGFRGKSDVKIVHDAVHEVMDGR